MSDIEHQPLHELPRDLAGRVVLQIIPELNAGGAERTTIDVAAALGVPFEERAFTRAEAMGAREAFFSSATTIAMPVVAIDGQAIGDGRPGPVTTRLRGAFHEIAARS